MASFGPGSIVRAVQLLRDKERTAGSVDASATASSSRTSRGGATQKGRGRTRRGALTAVK